MRKIDKIIIHCTASKAGRDFSAEDIRRLHVDVNRWSDIGYHFVIRLDGTVEDGRPVSVVGAHCLGQNATSIGIAYVGGLDANGKPADTRTSEQRVALARLVDYLKRKYPGATVHGHNEFANKYCPCFDVKKEFS